ncbi:MAG: tetratricopeptide repeat protein [Anaerolineae bacterium]|nr:tetratricopeptide repeat protein [Anaerolineae bacterium]
MSEATWLSIEYADSGLGDAVHDLCRAYLVSVNRLLDEGKIERAVEYAGEALRLARSVDDRLGEWAALGSLGNICYETGQFQSAFDHYTQALSVAQTTGHRRGEGYLCFNLGLVYHHLGDDHRATLLAERAFDILNALGDGRAVEIRARLRQWIADRS